MTEKQKEQIVKLRETGYGYIRIAQAIGVSENTVKSFCRRNNMSGMAKSQVQRIEIKPDIEVHFCLNCGIEVKQNPGRKEKRFCSDKCRNAWWNHHLDKVNRKTVYEYTCPHCGRLFSVYGNAHRKYCSHACYITDRFGGDIND